MLSPAALPEPVIRALVQAWARLHGGQITYRDGVVHLDRKGQRMTLARAHLAYVPVMLRYFDTYWNAVIDDHGAVDYSRPALHTYRATGLQFWTPSMPEEREAFRGYLHRYRPQPGDVIFDFGAHAGVTTYEFARLVGETGKVYAFEPDPLAFSLLERNIALHDLTNVVPLQVAIAERAGRRRFNADASLGATFSDIVDRHGMSATVEVECWSLADACRQLSVEPRFIKMDIEGAEIEVVRGAVSFLISRSIDFAIDTNHPKGGLIGGLLSGRYTDQAVESLFRKAGYETESSREYAGFLTTWAWR